ncbi:gephyrin-like molybdotransferase receptor GlpR [Nocardia sp. NPDC051570]|uniref:divisome protein SepX/GlpR n=1 Tax=Nocardia sp. NPDC051570 TaxID=3364324 RepID=UPI0037BD2ADF
MPNSILWIGLVVLWVFVLFPMLADRHPRIRRTTDAALATRVLHRGGTKRRMRKGPGAGHETDPDWIPARVQRKLSHGDDAEDRMTTSADEPVIEDETTGGAGDPAETPVAESATDAEVIDAEVDEAETDGGDEEESGDIAAEADVAPADNVETDRGEEVPERPRAAALPARPSAPRDIDEAEDEFESEAGDFVPTRRGRGGYDPEADAIARAARYRFRQRSTLGLVLSMLLFGGFAMVITPMLWWACGLSGIVLVTYLIYLRRQVRMEEEIRRRRAARLSRDPQADDDEYEDDEDQPHEERPTLDRDTARALRRRAVVLDVDDEDPMFDHLEPFDAAAARATRNRAAGGEIRRAAGE